MSVIDTWGILTHRPGNPLTVRPRRYWSQADEDGILVEILERIGSLPSGIFVEFGVGDGAQCNTLVLLARGWAGAWLSGQQIIFEPRPGGRLVFDRAWITRDNVISLLTRSLGRIRSSSAVAIENVNVVSLDLDGNDYHIAEQLLAAGLRPNVWIAEYNARFPVGAEWVMPYDEAHVWADDDYYGASLSAFASLFQQYDYFPVACSAQGSNVFFVRKDHEGSFSDVPKDLNVLYRPLLSFTRKWGHRESPRTLQSLT